jgi:hypothetical protein
MCASGTSFAAIVATPEGVPCDCFRRDGSVSAYAYQTPARDDEHERSSRLLLLDETSGLPLLDRGAARYRVGRGGAALGPRPQRMDRGSDGAAAASASVRQRGRRRSVCSARCRDSSIAGVRIGPGETLALRTPSGTRTWPGRPNPPAQGMTENRGVAGSIPALAIRHSRSRLPAGATDDQGT